MTSKNSFSEGKLLRDGLRRNLWSIVLSGLAFFFTLPLPVLMSAQRILESKTHYAFPADQKLWEDRLRTGIDNLALLVSGDNPAVKLAFIALAVVCGVAAFAYLHSRQKVDFYHSLPISRGRLYATNFLTGILCTIPMYFIMLALSLLCLYATGFSAAVRWSEIVGSIVCNLIFFLLIYALSAVTTILCGNTVITLLLLLWVHFSLAAVRGLQVTLCDLFLDTYVTAGRELLLYKLSPVISYFMLNGLSYDSIENGASAMGLLLVYLVIALAVTALGWYLFRIRKSERAGTALAFDPPKVPIKAYMCVVAGIAGALLFYAIADSFLWFWVGMVIGAALMHAVVEIIYDFDFRALFRKPIHLAVIVVVMIAATLCLQFDIVGYDRWLPDEDKIAAVAVNGQIYGYKALEDDMLISPENIQAVRTLAEAGIRHMEEDSSLESTLPLADGDLADIDISYAETIDVQSTTISYRLSNGRMAYREYLIPLVDENVQTAYSILGSEEYKRAYWPLFHYLEAWDAEDAGKPVLSIVQAAKNNVDSTATPSVATADYEATTRAYVGEEWEWYDFTDKEKIRQIIETLREESLTRSETGAVPVLCLKLNMQDPENPEKLIAWNHGDNNYNNYYYSDAAAYVTAQDTKTLALLKQAGFEPINLAAEAENVTEIQIYKTVVTDRAEIAALLQNAFSEDMLEVYGYHVNSIFDSERGSDLITESLHVAVYCYFSREDRSYYLSYPYGKAPLDIISKYYNPDALG